jgi:hypothetical protein
LDSLESEKGGRRSARHKREVRALESPMSVWPRSLLIAERESVRVTQKSVGEKIALLLRDEEGTRCAPDSMGLAGSQLLCRLRGLLICWLSNTRLTVAPSCPSRFGAL